MKLLRSFATLIAMGWRFYTEDVPARMDEFTARLREQTGQEPDWKVERRRAKRRVQ